MGHLLQNCWNTIDNNYIYFICWKNSAWLGASMMIQSILAPLRIHTCFWPHRTLRQTLVRLKDQTPLQQRASVIYQIPCGTCSNVYIGQTGRALVHHLNKHKRALASGNAAQSAVAEHAVEQMHVINWNEAEVVACHHYYCQRCTLEAWHIRTVAQTMNRDAGPLPSVYDP